MVQISCKMNDRQLFRALYNMDAGFRVADFVFVYKL